MNVQLTTFSKRRNSTKTPATFDTTRDCTLKEGCSILTPLLRFARSTMDHEYNYVYIPDFDRYYYVRDIIYDGALIYYDCVVDALASWKTEIGTSDQYVLRSASQWDGNIVDNLYPTKTEKQYRLNTIDPQFALGTDPNTGSYSVGIVGANGGTIYYLFEPSVFKVFMDYLLSDTYAADVLGILALTANPQLKMAIDPLEYISSITWIPFLVGSELIQEVQSIKYGVVTVPVRAYLITFNIQSRVMIFTQLYKHPLTDTRGNYLNTSPFTKVSLGIPPYGLIDIDPIDLLNAVSLTVQYLVDLRTGTSTCHVYTTTEPTPGVGEPHLISILSGNVGIPVQISAVRQMSGLGALSVYTRAIASSAVSAAASGGLSFNNIVGGQQAIGDAAASMIPSASMLGSTGGFDSLAGNIQLSFEFLTPVDDDVTQRGRPLCKQVTINTLSGYVLCSNAEIELPATDTEIAEIINYLNGGFFYE